jgi:uncharacterized protein (TIGR02266 family)
VNFKKDRRKHQRVSIDVLVNYTNYKIFFCNPAMNISKGGIFIKAKNPEPKGSEIKMVFRLPDNSREIHTTGKVVFVNKNRGQSGMGIKFTDITPEDLTLVENYVKSFREEGGELEGVDPAGQRRARVLVVDDESVIRKICKRTLEINNFMVTTADDGNEALRIVAEEGIDVVLLDIKMPGLSGIEVLKNIKQNHPETEVIMMTGYATVQTAVESMKIGAYDYLTKPFEDISQISECVSRAFSQKKVTEAKMAKKKQLLQKFY